MAEYIFEINDALFDEETGNLVMQPEFKSKLIRCKDCKYHHRDNSGAYYCGRKEYGYGWGLNDFCSDAERRTDD